MSNTKIPSTWEELIHEMEKDKHCYDEINLTYTEEFYRQSRELEIKEAEAYEKAKRYIIRCS
jgi:hypothetical protein